LTSFFAFLDKKLVVADPRDIELLVLSKNDDKSAIKTLFEKYHAGLCLLAYRFTKDKDISKDLVQDVFIRFWNNRQSIEVTVSLLAYLRRSVINACLNYVEKEQRHSMVDVEVLTRTPSTASSDGDYSEQELTRQLEEAIERLPFRTRAVFLLVRKEEMSYKEVAENLDISLKAVEKEMMKALRLLREMLKNFLPTVILISTLL
jgi:RNA polymerase sigma-70 factor (ECF subfamily)